MREERERESEEKGGRCIVVGFARGPMAAGGHNSALREGTHLAKFSAEVIHGDEQHVWGTTGGGRCRCCAQHHCEQQGTTTTKRSCSALGPGGVGAR